MEALGLNPVSIAIHAINFLILLFVLQRFLFKPVMAMLDERSQKIRESVEARERAQEEDQGIINRAEQEAAAEPLQAMQELRAQVADLAVMAAGRVTRR